MFRTINRAALGIGIAVALAASAHAQGTLKLAYIDPLSGGGAST